MKRRDKTHTAELTCERAQKHKVKALKRLDKHTTRMRQSIVL